MDFIIMVIAFGAGFVTITYIAEFIRSLNSVKQEPREKDCRETNTMHTWFYDTDGFMKCKICKRIPFND